MFQAIAQNETSITLQWNKVDDILNYRLLFNGSEINVTTSAGNQVEHTIPGLTSGTKYVFTLLAVYESVRSSGVTLSAVTGKFSSWHRSTTRQSSLTIYMIEFLIHWLVLLTDIYDCCWLKRVEFNEATITLLKKIIHILIHLPLCQSRAKTKLATADVERLYSVLQQCTVYLQWVMTLYTPAPLIAEEFKTVAHNETDAVE